MVDLRFELGCLIVYSCPFPPNSDYFRGASYIFNKTSLIQFGFYLDFNRNLVLSLPIAHGLVIALRATLKISCFAVANRDGAHLGSLSIAVIQSKGLLAPKQPS